MAEDIHNPLNNSAAVAERPGESNATWEPDDLMPDAQMADLDAFLDSELGLGAPEPTPEPEPSPAPEPMPAPAPEPAPLPPSEPAPPAPQAAPAGGAPAPAAAAPPPGTAPAAGGERAYRWGNEMLTAQEFMERGHMREVYNYAQTQLQQQYVQQQAPPQPQQYTGDDLVTQYQPVIDNLINQGFLEPSLADANPRGVAFFIHSIAQLSQSSNQGAQAYQYAQVQQQQYEQQQNEARFRAVANEVANRGPFYEELKDEAKLIEFSTYLREDLNPVFGWALDPNNLAKAYLAYKSDVVSTLLSARDSRAQPPAAAAMASSENGSSRGAGLPAPATEPWADVLAGMAPGF